MVEPNTENRAENTLRKVLALRYLDRLPEGFGEQQHALEQRHIAGALLKGSGAVIFRGDDLLIPKGVNDLEVGLCSIEGMRSASTNAKNLFRRMMESGAERAGLSLTEWPAEDLGWHHRLLAYTGRKAYYKLEADPVKLAADALADDGFAKRLTAADREILSHVAHGKEQAPALMEVNLHLGTRHVDIAPVDKEGRELSRKRPFGVGAVHPLASIVGAVQFINFAPWIDKVYIELANATAALHGGKGLLPEDVTQITQDIYLNDKSSYREYHTYRKLFQLFESVQMRDAGRFVTHLSTLLEPTDVFRHPEPTEARAGQLAASLNHMREINILHRDEPFTKEEALGLLTHTHTISRALLNGERSLVTPEGLGGREKMGALLGASAPMKAPENAPPSPAFVQDIIRRQGEAEKGLDGPQNGGQNTPPGRR